MKKPLVHSFSSLDLFELCPLKFYHEKVAKDIKFVETEQVKWGNEVHKALELAVAQDRPLDKRFEQYQKIVDGISGVPAVKHTELKLAVNKDMQTCEFFGSGVYIRGVGDLVLEYPDKLTAIDWKTGKQKHASKQLALMALLLFAKFPHIETIHTAFVWLQTSRTTKEVFTRDSVPSIWALFEQTIKEVEWCYENDKWPARENFLCKGWCEVYDCIYNGRKK